MDGDARLKVGLFGASSLGRQCLEQLRRHTDGAEVACFFDNDKGKWHTTLEGVPVLEPSPPALHAVDVIWLTTAYADEVRAQLTRLRVQTRVAFTLSEVLGTGLTTPPVGGLHRMLPARSVFQLRVLHLAPMLQSGAGRLITDLAVEMRQSGVEAHVVSSGTTPVGPDWESFVQRLRTFNVPYSTLDLFKRDPCSFWNSVAELKQLLRRFQFDILHAHAGVPAAAARSALDLLGLDVPLVTTFYSWGINRPQWMDLADIHAFSRSTRVTVGTEYSRHFLTEMGLPLERIDLVRWGIPEASMHIKPDRRSLLDYFLPESTADDEVYVNLAVIEPRKNQEAAIRALSHLQTKRSRLLCIGSIKDKLYHRQLENLVQELGLNSRVRFAGFVDYPLPLVAASDGFIFPSLSEGLGLAIVEAMALRVPVLAQAVEGAGELIRHGQTALAIDPDNPEETAAALARITNDRAWSRALADRALELVQKLYLFRTTVSETRKVYEKMVACSGVLPDRVEEHRQVLDDSSIRKEIS
jgi:glycosyltransferase involved in cell wall biosynthesis